VACPPKPWPAEIFAVLVIDVVQRHDDGRMDVTLAGRSECFAVSQTHQHQFRQM